MNDPTPTPTPGSHAANLLEAALVLAGELDAHRLANGLRPWLVQPGVSQVGIALIDSELHLLTTWSFSPEAGKDEVIEPVQHSYGAVELARYQRPRRIQRGDPDRGPMDHWLFAKAATVAITAPIFLGPRFLGFLYVALLPDADVATLETYYQMLGRLIGPIAWNCHSQTRFEHGDQRRQALIELSDAINQSLKLDTVVDSTRQAMRHLSGLTFSAIMMIEDEKEEYVSYPSTPGSDKLEPPLRHPFAGSVLEEVLRCEDTIQSEDLDRRHAFEEDERLSSLGVRRYVAAPMFVRGRIIGCVLVGRAASTPALGVDVWLYENIALQVALAVDNARQLEQVRQLSDRLAQQNKYLREEIQSEHDIADMIGESSAMKVVREAINLVGPTTSTVLISGETGVGKELVARGIHAASTRADQPMVKVNCAAMPEGMVESELFGHERGAFTSAVERRIGRFELANGGTLFLDEVGELSPAVQAKLLRVLQDGDFERVGGSKTLSTNARIIAATNRDLLQSVQDGSFRSDLYYRLNVFPLQVPPLRERAEDVEQLIRFFVGQFNRRMGKQVESVDPDTLADLCSRPWPGNIRELRHEIERAMILCEGPVLTIGGAKPSPGAAATGRPASPNLDDAQAEHIRWALEQTGGVVEGDKGAARLLGLKPSTLRFRMKRLGIRRPSS